MTRPNGSTWQPDLFNGRGIERHDTSTRSDELAAARQEMRDTGSNDLFDVLKGDSGMSDSIYTETIWRGLSENERRSLRTTLESIDIASRIGQYLENEVYFLAVTPEDRQDAVAAMHKWLIAANDAR